MNQKQSTFLLTTPEWKEAGCSSFADVLGVFFRERRERDEKRVNELSRFAKQRRTRRSTLTRYARNT